MTVKTIIEGYGVSAREMVLVLTRVGSAASQRARPPILAVTHQVRPHVAPHSRITTVSSRFRPIASGGNRSPLRHSTQVGRPERSAKSIVFHRVRPSRKGTAPDTSGTSASPSLTALPISFRATTATTPQRPDLRCGRFCGRPQARSAGHSILRPGPRRCRDTAADNLSGPPVRRLHDVRVGLKRERRP